MIDFKNKNILVYGRSQPSCQYCENLKNLFEVHNISYEYKDISDEEVYMEFCQYRLKTVPAIFADNSYIGGFTEASQIIKEKGE